MRSMLSRLGFVGLWVAGSLLPSTLDPFRASQHGWAPAAAQASEMQEQWRLLQDAQAAYQRGILAAQRGDSTAAETAWAIASAGFRRVIQDNPQRTDLYAPLADIQIRRGQPAAAYALLIQAVRAGTKDLSLRIQVVRASGVVRGRTTSSSCCAKKSSRRCQFALRRPLNSSSLSSCTRP